MKNLLGKFHAELSPQVTTGYGLTRASPGPHQGLTRASPGPHLGLTRASPGPHLGLTRALPTQVNIG